MGVRRAALAVATLALILGLANVVIWHFDLAREPAYDFQINWVAAHRLADREPLYDRAASRADGVELVGPEFEVLSGTTLSSFIGSPVTALTYVPFTGLEYRQAADAWRLMTVALMCLAVVVAAMALRRESRLLGALAGLAALAWSFPVAMSVGLGQVDGMIMLALAVALWASARQRWAVVGVALAVATVLKISPVLLILYLVLRGSRRVLVPAVATTVGLVLTAAAVGRPGDLFDWVRTVVPEVGRSGRVIENQSLPAWLARVFGAHTDWTVDIGLGAWRSISWLVVIAGLATVSLISRRQRFRPLELGAVILIALLAGPISWHHYASWATLVVVLLADLQTWRAVTRAQRAVSGALLVAGLIALRRWTVASPITATTHSLYDRLESGATTIGLLMFFVVVCGLLWWSRTEEPSTRSSVPVDSQRRRRGDAAHLHPRGASRSALVLPAATSN